MEEWHFEIFCFEKGIRPLKLKHKVTKHFVIQAVCYNLQDHTENKT